MEILYMPFIATLILYFLSSIWSIGFFFYPHRFGSRVLKWFVIIGFFTHTCYLIFLGIQSKNIPVTNIFESIIFLVWCIIFIFLAVDFLYKLPSILVFLMPFVTGLSIWSLTFINSELVISRDLQKFWLVAHIIPTFFGYASFAITFIASVMYITQQRQLRLKASGNILIRLPSLEGLDKLIWKTLSFGFPLITSGLIFGFIWIRLTNALGSAWYLDHKVVFGTVTWLVYAAILHIRMIASFHGTKVAILTIAGFALIIFTFIGTFFTGSKHGFQKVSDTASMERVIN